MNDDLVTELVPSNKRMTHQKIQTIEVLLNHWLQRIIGWELAYATFSSLGLCHIQFLRSTDV